MDPCPFCGSDAVTGVEIHDMEDPDIITHGVLCEACGATVEEYPDQEGAAEAWNRRAGADGQTSDGYHTFDELYHHRAVMFAALCRQVPELAWKSKNHHSPDDPMFEGMFIVGIDTPAGPVTYHYDIDPYWDLFPVKELTAAPEWDGATPADGLVRLGSLKRGTAAGKEKAVLLAALNLWGPQAQTLMMFEEMSELQKELCKWARGGDNCEAIAEEIADVSIMLEQMILLHDVSERVAKYRAEKLARLERREKEYERT